MNQQIISLLVQSFSGTDSLQVMNATEQLLAYAPFQGFLPTLMSISTNTEIDQNITCAALTQIKNCVRRYWDVKEPQQQNNFLHRLDKQYLRDNIIALNISLSDNTKYANLIKDIIAMIANSLIQKISVVLGMMERGQQLRTCLNFLLGMIGGFRIYQFEIQKKRIEFISVAVPQLTNLMINAQMQLNVLHDEIEANPTQDKISNYNVQSAFLEEIMYLSIKFMSKVIDVKIPFEVRQWLVKWGEVCLNRLNDVKLQYHTKDISSRQTPIWQKQSQIFVYFHGRKWAIQYLNKFMEKILIYKSSQPEISNLTKQFYQNNWESLISIVKKLFQHQQTNKIRICQLKLLQRLFTTKPKLMQLQLYGFLFQILPRYVIFDEDDITLAFHSPIQYLAYEDELQNQTQNLRFYAAELWVSLVKDYGQRLMQYKSIQSSNTHNEDCFNFIEQLVNSNERQYHLVGVYLMQKLCKKLDIPLSGRVMKKVSKLTNKILQKFLNSQDFLLQSMILEIFKKNIDQIQRQTRKKVFSFVARVFENHPSKVQVAQLVKINAVIVLQKFTPAELLQVSDEVVENLLEIYLQMLAIYELGDIMHSFKVFMGGLKSRIKPYAIKIVHTLGQSVHNIGLSTQISNHSNNYFSMLNKTGVYSGVIEAISILCSLIDQESCQLKQAIQYQLDLILQQFFACDQNQENYVLELAQDIFYLLKEYMTVIRQKNQQISPQIRFYYSVMAFKLSQLPLNYFTSKYPENLPAKKVQVLQNCISRQEYLFIDYFHILKLFLKFIKPDDEVRKLTDIKNTLLESNELQQLFYLIFCYYQSKATDYHETDAKGRIISTLLLIYLLEEHGGQLKESTLHYIFIVIRLNFKKNNFTRYTMRYNKQLFYIWIWIYLPKFIKGDFSQKAAITSCIVQVLKKQDKMVLETQFYEEKRRILLAYCALLVLTVSIPQIKAFRATILDILFWIMQSIMSVYEQQQLSNQDEIQTAVEENRFKVGDYDQTHMSHSDSEFADQPNYLIQLPIQQGPTTENYHQELREFSDPIQIYDLDYISNLDSIQNEYLPFFQSLMYFQTYQPAGYKQVFANINYKRMLDELIQLSQKNPLQSAPMTNKCSKVERTGQFDELD